MNKQLEEIKNNNHKFEEWYVNYIGIKDFYLSSLPIINNTSNKRRIFTTKKV